MKATLAKYFTAAKARLFKPPKPDLPEVISAARSEPDFDWQYLVTPGHVIFARLNHLSFIGKRLFTIVAIAGLLYFVGGKYALELTSKAASSGTTVAASYDAKGDQIPDFHVLTSELINTATQFNMNAVKDQIMDVSTLKSDFIDKSVRELNSTGNITTPCFKSNSLMRPWHERLVVYYPFCNSKAKTDSAPKHLWVYVLLTDKGQVKPWIGVFVENRKWFGLQKTWAFKNVVDDNHLLIRPSDDKIETIDINLLKNTLKTDFIDLPVTKQAVAKKLKYDFIDSPSQGY